LETQSQILLKPSHIQASGGLASSTAVLGYSRAFGLEPLLDLPRNLHRLTVSYVDGLFFNPLHMALALIGILSLSKKGDSLSRLFVIWLAVVSLIFPFSQHRSTISLIVRNTIPNTHSRRSMGVV